MTAAVITLTRADTAAQIELNGDLQWTDIHQWAPVEETVVRGLTGALIVQQGVRLCGQPVTLESGQDGYGLVQRSTLAELEAWAGVPGLEMTLNFHGKTLPVAFRHVDGAITATPYWIAGAPEQDDYLQIVLRLRTR